MNTNTIAALTGTFGLIVAAIMAIGDALQLPGWFQVVAILLALFSLCYGYAWWLQKRKQ
jgi:hypothetical protein